MDRVRQVNFIENLAGDISSAMPADIEPSDAKDVVEWWMSEDGFENPDWWDERDTNLLIERVAKGLKGEIK